MSVVWFVVLTTIGVAMVAALFFVIPGAVVSILRYRLWAVRDKLFDQIYGGVYTDNEQPKRLLRQVETTIQVFGDMTFVNVMLAVFFMHRVPQPKADHFDPHAMKDIDREKIMPLVWSWGGTMLRRIFLASWSGLLVFTIATPIAILSAAFRRLFHRQDKDHDSPIIEPSVIEQVKVEFRKQVHIENLPFEVLARPNGRKTKVALSSFH